MPKSIWMLGGSPNKTKQEVLSTNRKKCQISSNFQGILYSLTYPKPKELDIPNPKELEFQVHGNIKHQEHICVHGLPSSSIVLFLSRGKSVCWLLIWTHHARNPRVRMVLGMKWTCAHFPGRIWCSEKIKRVVRCTGAVPPRACWPRPVTQCARRRVTSKRIGTACCQNSPFLSFVGTRTKLVFF